MFGMQRNVYAAARFINKMLISYAENTPLLAINKIATI